MMYYGSKVKKKLINYCFDIENYRIYNDKVFSLLL